jgi:hypothetical protein
MSRTIEGTIGVAIGLARDAFGNTASGNEERAMRYLALQVELLTSLGAALADRNDSRKTTALDNLARSIAGDKHPGYERFPEIDGEGFKTVFPVRIKTVEDIRDYMLTASLPDAVSERILSSRKPGESTVTTTLTAEEAREMFGPKH